MSLPLHRVRRKLRVQPFRRPFDPSLVLYLPFFEGSGDHVTDESIYGNHGSFAAETWTEGKLGPAPNLDGVDDIISVSHSSSLAMTDAVTVALWLYLRNYPIVNEFDRLFEKSLSLLLYGDQAGTYRFRIMVNDTTYDTSFGVVSKNVWHSLVATYDKDLPSDQRKVYLDSELVKTATLTDPFDTGTNLIYIGNTPALNRGVDGIIDEVRVYERALEPREILALYRATV